MESQQTSTSFEGPTPLFPAYSTDSQNQKVNSEMTTGSQQASISSKASSSLFPAYTSDGHSQEVNSEITMGSQQASTSSKASSSLFPAYTSDAHSQEDKKEWLYNSSFSVSAFNEAYSQLTNLQNAEASLESIVKIPSEKKVIKKEKEKKKKSQKKRKYEKYSDSSSFTVPESDSIFFQLKKKTFIEETGLSFERAFLKDSAPDPENLMFESFERTKIARYHSSLKIPVGISSDESVLFSLFLPPRKEKAPSRYFNKNVLKILNSTPTEKICSVKEPLTNTSLCYIPISLTSDKFIQSQKFNSAPDFINVSSSWKTETSKNEKITEEKSSVELVNSELRDQIIYFNKKLSEEPTNVEMWIDFLDFQDKIFASQMTGKDFMSSDQNLVEKKISILDKALKYNPKDVMLNVLKLKISQNLYSPEKLSSMWENLIFFNPNNPYVWQEYLLYCLSNLTIFNVNNILRLYSKCLKTLSSISEGETQSHEPSPDIVLNMLEICKQLCYILNSCGYTEKAIAIYQALIEFNLFCESDVEKLSVNEKIICFEPFWDSGAPRIGEKDAIGWTNTVQQKKISFDYISTDSDLNNLEDEILNKKLSLSETWLEFEKLREIHHWLPWKPNPEYDQTCDDIDDPDRTVPFDDVSKFLFTVQDEENKFLLITQFITILGLDLHSLDCFHYRNRTFHNPYSMDCFEKLSLELSNSQLIHNFANPFPSKIRQLNEEKYNFINNILTLILNKFSPKYKMLSVYVNVKIKQYFTLYANNRESKNISDLKKYVKGILKKNENRNCLLLWCEYIYIEWLSDKSSALKTFQTLLLSSTYAVSAENMPLWELWYFVQFFIELHLTSQNFPDKVLSPNDIIWILIHVANKEKYVPHSNEAIKPTMLLKATSAFKRTLEKELHSLESLQSSLCYCIDPYSYSVINCAKCYAYFQYFTQGNEAAMQVYEYVISFITSNVTGHIGRYISEQMHVAQAKILNFYTWSSTTSLKPLQMFLYDSIRKYPHNAQLLYILVKLRSASSAISPTRRFFTQILKNNHKSHPMTWLFTLIAEFVLYFSILLQNDVKEDTFKEFVSNLGLNWRIRSLYEKMLQSDACAHISLLWRSYLKFEVMTQNMEKAKSVFHRSLQNCGWSKELLMDAVQYFPDELNEVLAFMTEKQIRIHTPLEEITLLMEHTVTIS